MPLMHKFLRLEENEMKAFETPVVEVVMFSVEDVITESGATAPAPTTPAGPTPPALVPPCVKT